MSAHPTRGRNLALIALKSLLHLLALLPLIYLVFSVRHGGFSADPAKDIQHFTGLIALKLLMLTLLISPLSHWLKQPLLLRCRRLVGLWCFTWATLHLLSYYFLELGVGNLSLLGEEIIRRPYLTLGMAGWCLLVLMAMTSFSALRKRLGQRWYTLHNTLRILAIVMPIHYLWSVKAYSLQPFLWLACGILLCLLRLPLRGKKREQ